MNTKLDLSGLSAFSNLVQQPPAAAAAAKGKPLVLPLDAIEEDPDQPRREFDAEALQELADSIAAKGVKSPISVRPHPSQPDRYIINHGARRWRASKLAGKTEIPVFIDENHDDIDQLAENIQRENLSTREIVDAIARMLSNGTKQAEIARQLGKSRAWVSKHAALADLPEPLSAVLASGRCRDASTLYEALQCWKVDQDAVVAYLLELELGDRQMVQADIERLRADITRKQSQPAEPNAVTPPELGPTGEPAGTETSELSVTDAAPPAVVMPVGDVANDDQSAASDESVLFPNLQPNADAADHGMAAMDDAVSGAGYTAGEGDDPGDDDGGERRQNLKPQSKAEPDPTKVRKPVIQVRVGRREAVLLVSRKAAYGLAWVEYEDGSVDEVDVAKVKLVAITDAAK